MPDKFSEEIKIVNAFRKYLTDNGWKIYQLVCSGGQAHLSISYKKGSCNKTIFPDVIAVRNGKILVGEIKEKFNYEDETKLRELSSSELAKQRLIKNISLRSGTPQCSLSIDFALIHSEVNIMTNAKLTQFIFDGNDFFLV